MTSVTRRHFLRNASLGVATAALARRTVQARPIGANDDVRVAIAGLGVKGGAHLGELLAMPGVRVAALCEPDPERLAKGMARANEAGARPIGAADPRRLLERDDIDALIIAAPDHWHALLAVWGCQAGMDVFVEKPVSNTVWEGRQIIAAAARYGRIAQAGTQARSDPGILEAAEYVRSGQLGKVLWAHALWLRERLSIGRRLPWYPEGVDYDVFCGPAPVRPLVRETFHYDWHWFWEMGNGEITNLGTHCVDLARLFAGIDSLPTRVRSVGGRFVLGDAGETPNTQLTIFEHPACPFIMETRGLHSAPGSKVIDQFRGQRTGVVVQCEGGYFAGHNGGFVYDNAGKRIRGFPGDGGAGHLANFLDAVRSREDADLRAPIAQGDLSTATCLYGSVSYRLGEEAPPAAASEVFEAHDFAAQRFADLSRHLGVHGVDLERTRYTVGPWIKPDASDDLVAEVEGGDADALALARHIARGVHRPPFVVPGIT